MTPRQADVAFVLEGVPGVRAVYATAGGPTPHDFAVEVDNYIAMGAAHYALLRVLTHEECERVRLLTPQAPGPGRGARRLSLDDATREAARSRVPLPLPRGRLDLLWRHILVVDADISTAALARSTFGRKYPCHTVANVTHGVGLASSTLPWCLLLVDSRLAFGAEGVLARLPLELKPLIFVIADPAEVPEATRSLGGSERLLTRPLSPLGLWKAFDRATASLSTPDVPESPKKPARKITRRDSSAPLRVLLVDVDGEFDTALGRIFGGEIEFVAKLDVDEAVEYAFSNSVSVMVCGDRPAQRFIAGIAREDEDAGRRIIVATSARDLFHLRDVLAMRRRHNQVIALPLEDETLRAAILDAHPELAIPPLDAIPKVVRPAYRRLAVLVIDEDASTQILFSAGMSIEDTDLAHESSSLAAFEHVLSRPVDVLFVSTSLRSDSGEAFYRSLWRMKPELKARTVLITAADAAPPSARDTKLPRILERPVSRTRLAEIMSAFRQATA